MLYAYEWCVFTSIINCYKLYKTFPDQDEYVKLKLYVNLKINVLSVAWWLSNYKCTLIL